MTPSFRFPKPVETKQKNSKSSRVISSRASENCPFFCEGFFPGQPLVMIAGLLFGENQSEKLR